MQRRIPVRVVRTCVVVLIAGALLTVGRLTVRPDSAAVNGYQVGHSDGYDEGYLAGLRDGVVQGREEGRVLQEGDTVPAAARRPVTVAFKDGYVAGANDVFAGYDGGWELSAPYLVTVERATPPMVYRIDSRTPVLAGVDYFLCTDGRTLCQAPRR